MKKLIVIGCVFSVVFSGCKKTTDRVFEKSADERLTETLSKYQAQLSGAQNGWKALLTTDSGRGSIHSFYFKFSNDNRVIMLSDFDSISAVTPKESSYRLKALQQPSLLFDTYSYLHVLSNPDASQNGGAFGAGLISDFEFFFDSTATDTIKLIGRFNGSKLMLIKATQAEGNSYNSGALASGLSINKILTYFKRLNFNNQLFDVQIDPASHSISFTWIDATGSARIFTTNYYLTINGINLSTPLIAGNITITSLNGITFNQSTETISLTINGTAATIQGIVVPLKVDVGAPKRWWNYSADRDDYWITRNGFHVNGVDDALNWRSVPNYSGFTLFWAKYGTSGGINYDLLGPIVNDSLNFGAAYRPPVFTTDGRIVFRFLGTLGTVPASANATFISMRTKFAESGGYYFVQIDDAGLVYDMVSATDGKAWIRWEW